MFRLLLAFSLLVISITAKAESYYWIISFPADNARYVTAVAACNANHTYYQQLNPGYDRYDQRVVVGETSFYCETTGLRRNAQGVYEPYGRWGNTANRRGDSCQPGENYDPNVGGCEVPPGEMGEACEGPDPGLTKFGYVYNSQGQCVDYTRADTASQCKLLAGTSAPTKIAVVFNDDGSPQIPPPMNVGGCAGIVASVEHCEMAPVRCGGASGNSCMQSSVNTCKVLVSFSGAVSGDGKPLVIKGHEGSEEGVCQPGDACDPAPTPIQNEEKPCVYVEDGEGRRVCDSNKWTGQPGEKSCGTVNGQLTCIGKSPTSNGISIGTVVEEKANVDGTKTVTKTDVHNETKCIGAGSCKTETTTNKTVIVKDSAGNTIGQSGSCTGPKCATDGKGDKNGDGLDDCKSGEDCTDEEEFEGPTNGDAGSFGDSLGNFTSRVKGAPIIASASSLTFASGGSCSMPSFSVPVLGTLSFQPMCQWAADWFAPIKMIMLALWALVAVRTFLEA